MTYEIKSRAYRLLQAAKRMPEDQWESFIAERAVVDPEAAEVAARMLRSSRAAGDSDLPKLVILPTVIKREGTIVDGWQVQTLLGEGGFGRVYRARSADGQKDTAAIKFLDKAPSKVQRFRNECQSLVDLDHKGICKFINAGVARDGAPYMVMECVDGAPITDYCDRQRLNITARLRLFMKLCDAVEYAHQQRVLHRDLKPVNILVTKEGDVQVMDFGVAKWLDSSQRLTRQLDDKPWTKGYASPEQVVGGELSFATDVYALGVVLYQLVSGQLPFSEKALNRRDWARTISEAEPQPPSQALLGAASDDDDHKPETAAQLRGASPRGLKRQLKGNLDAVVLKALRKNAEQRYDRVEQFSSDIDLVLEGLPVTARRCGMRERVWNRAVKCPATAVVMIAAFLSVLYPFFRGFPGQIADKAALHDQEYAGRQLEHLAEIGLPEIENALPRGPEAMDARRLAVRIHTRLLQNMEVLPDYTLRDLDSGLAVSALRCAREWISLGDPRAALAVTAAILPRAATRYDSDRLDGQRRQVLIEILRQRIELHRLLNQEAEAADETRLIQDIAGRRP